MVPMPTKRTKWFMRIGDEKGELVAVFKTHYPSAGAWGIVLADLAHHVAEAYCQRDGTFDPRPILREIIEIMNREMRHSTSQRACFAVRTEPEPTLTSGVKGGRR